jgi:hypothetical protein
MIKEHRFDIADPLPRHWFIYQIIPVEKNWKVELFITSTGLLIKSKDEQVHNMRFRRWTRWLGTSSSRWINTSID